MDDSSALTSPLEEAPWHPFKRVLFRFAFCYIVLYYPPSVLADIPGGGLLVHGYERAWSTLCGWIGVSLFHLDHARAFPHPTGSGDTTIEYIRQATTLLVAVVAGTLWTVLDRRRPHYSALGGWLRVLARYALAFALFSYAFAKIIPMQFPSLGSGQLAETYGQSSPMGLLWNFMGFSTAYTIFGGCAELVPAVLLVFRRTALLGSLLASTVMLNVVMLNFCYDVPVKLYSLNLLLLAVFLALPDSRRLFGFFVLNRPTAPAKLTLPSIRRRWLRRTSLALKIVVLGIFLAQAIYGDLLAMVSLPSSPPASPLTTRGFHWIQEYPYNR